jgi:hypothetical protein
MYPSKARFRQRNIVVLSMGLPVFNTARLFGKNRKGFL